MQVEKSLVIIPTFNELENIRKLIPAVLSQDNSIHLLIVDDNSLDGTGNYVEEESRKNDRIHLLKREKKMSRFLPILKSRDSWLMRNALLSTAVRIIAEIIANFLFIKFFIL